jgi:hypothetical protein
MGPFGPGPPSERVSSNGWAAYTLTGVANCLVRIFRIGTIIIGGAAALGDSDAVAPATVYDFGVLVGRFAFGLGATTGDVPRVAISGRL